MGFTNSVLVTGSDGFLGSRVVKTLAASGFNLKAVTRNVSYQTRNEKNIEYLSFGELDEEFPWPERVLRDHCIVHCAGLAHAEDDGNSNYLFAKFNVDVTKRLAERAAASGASRFIFISSIGVNGDRTIGAQVFDSKSRPNPRTRYAASKWEAESVLSQIAATTGLDVVIIRSPLIYGSEPKGNMSRLINIVRSGVPLPLLSLTNRRSLVGIDNLVDLITTCITHKRAPGKTFLVSDGHDLTIPELLRELAAAMNVPLYLFPCPVIILQSLGYSIGRADDINRLVQSLIIDISDTRRELDWKPLVSVSEGLVRIFSHR
jgi:nucleoside-diphosphate-sugar epimerase